MTKAIFSSKLKETLLEMYSALTLWLVLPADQLKPLRNFDAMILQDSKPKVTSKTTVDSFQYYRLHQINSMGTYIKEMCYF